MHPDLKTVIELQQVDLHITDLSQRIEVVPAQIQKLETQLHDFLHAHEDRKTRLGANQKERKELEIEIQSIQAKISKHKEQLYQVKTNEQYRAMLKEIEGEEANIRRIEDKILEKMVEAEGLQKLVQEAAARLDGEKARVAQEEKQLDTARIEAEAERSQALARREVLAAALTEPVRETYERVRRGRRGVAVAEVKDGFCDACHVRLRPQMYNEVRENNAVLTCENCSRILYYIEPPAEEAEPSGDQTNRAAAPN